ncbi:MAG: GDSL-type esterase/lipase family protein [Candidatus Woesearchaeota archaeon]|jgi:lysophospholipase L1-like esterase
MEKKRIICYGDSNTWGYVPGTNFERFSEKIRFTKRLQNELGSKFEVIEEGLFARTLASEYQRSGKEGRNGKTYLVPCLLSHEPLNLVILMLGTTELKKEFNNSPKDIGKFLDKYYAQVIPKQKSMSGCPGPKLLIICPPIIDETIASPRYVDGTKKAKQLSHIYAEVARKNNCLFIDASNLEVGIDGVHMTAKSHKLLFEMLAKKIKEIKW